MKPAIEQFFGLKPNQCRWPLGDPTTGWCGAHVAEIGKPYCDEHAAISRPHRRAPDEPRKEWVNWQAF
jgi:hypothetical protein